jgi:hypothetical protein
MDVEHREGAAGGVRLDRAALGERSLVVGQAVLRLGVAQKPEHVQNSSGIWRGVVATTAEL